MKVKHLYLLVLLVMSIVTHAQQRIIGGSAVNIISQYFVEHIKS